MKTRTPRARQHLNIGKNDYVLEVGGGHNPHSRSNMVVDKFLDSNYHRSGNIQIHEHQKFMQADGENLPFEDKTFDYVICNQVLEHVEDPAAFLREQMRVAKRGYLECPSLMGEYLHPKASHKWLILEIEGKIVLMDKEIVGFKPSHDLGDVFLHYLPQHSIGYKMMQYTHGEVQNVIHEWEGQIEFLVNPTEERYIRYFKEVWTVETAEKFFPKRTLGQELWMATKAFAFIVKSVFKSKVLRSRKSVSVREQSA